MPHGNGGFERRGTAHSGGGYRGGRERPMGWSPEGQRQRYLQHTADEWLVWIDGLPVGGYAMCTKNKWLEWCDNMNELHGAYTMTRSGWQSTEALRNLARIFTETGGDAAAIAVLCRGGWESLFSAESLAADPPANAEDFAIKFMAGAYYPQRAARERRTGTAQRAARDRCP